MSGAVWLTEGGERTSSKSRAAPISTAPSATSRLLTSDLPWDPTEPLQLLRPLSGNARSPLRSLNTQQPSDEHQDLQQAHSSGSSPRSDMNGSTAELHFGRPKEFNLPGLHLPALAAVQIKAREVVLHRNVAGEWLIFVCSEFRYFK